MFARVSTITGPPDRIDDAARSFREHAVPFARQLGGFKGAYWLADRQSGTVLGVTLWESEETMRASEAAVEPAARRLPATLAQPCRAWRSMKSSPKPERRTGQEDTPPSGG